MVYSPQSIHLFYQNYRKNNELVETYSQKLNCQNLKKTNWLSLLKNFSFVSRNIYLENEENIKKFLYPLLEKKVSLTKELADAFMYEINHICTNQETDSFLTIDVLDLLIPYYKSTKNRDMIISSCFYRGFFYSSLNNTDWNQLVFRSYEKVTSYAEYYEIIDNPHIRGQILSAFYNRIQYISDLENGQCSYCRIQILEDTLMFYRNATVQSLPCNGFDLNGHISSIMHLLCEELLKPGWETFETQSLLVLQKEYMDYLEEYSKTVRLTCEQFFILRSYQLKQTCITEEEFYNSLHCYYREETSTFSNCMEEEGYVQYLSLIIRFFPSIIEGSALLNKPLWQEQIKIDLKKFAVKLSAHSSKDKLNITAYHKLAVNLSLFQKEHDILDLYLNVILSLQINTGIHINMVAQLTTSIARALLKEHPEYFVGILGMDSVQVVLEHQPELISFLYKAALYHDLGKLPVSSTINLQYRKIDPVEYETIKRHPDYGVKIIHSAPALNVYENVIRGHHRFYNGKGGYPENFNNLACKDKFAIDLITICDCLDAASDVIGRNYSCMKSLPCILNEFKRESGTRYNPQIVAFLMENKDLQQQLHATITTERQNTFYELYHTYRFA